MRVGDVQPRDSAPPRIVAVDPAAPVLSPNGDGVADTVALSAALSESAAWTFRVRDADGATIHEESGDGKAPSATWDGLVGGEPVIEGTYTYRIDATDAWGNAGYKTGSITVDLTGPTLGGVTPAADADDMVRAERRRRPRDGGPRRDGHGTRLDRRPRSGPATGPWFERSPSRRPRTSRP